jgi:hypothetical protein
MLTGARSPLPRCRRPLSRLGRPRRLPDRAVLSPRMPRGVGAAGGGQHPRRRGPGALGPVGRPAQPPPPPRQVQRGLVDPQPLGRALDPPPGSPAPAPLGRRPVPGHPRRRTRAGGRCRLPQPQRWKAARRVRRCTCSWWAPLTQPTCSTNWNASLAATGSWTSSAGWRSLGTSRPQWARALCRSVTCTPISRARSRLSVGRCENLLYVPSRPALAPAAPRREQGAVLTLPARRYLKPIARDSCGDVGPAPTRPTPSTAQCAGLATNHR